MTDAGHVEVSISHFPKLKDNYLFIDVEKCKVGRATGDLFFRKDADFVITQADHDSIIKRTLQHVPANRVICDFFTWDYALEKMKKQSRYDKLLQLLKEKGVNKLVGMDFSIFYGQPDPVTLMHLYLNFMRDAQAQSRGFQLLFNENTLYEPFRPLYEKILPENIPTLMIDNNHRQTKETVGYMIRALDMLCDISTVRSAIIQSGTQDLGGLVPYLSALRRHNIQYITIPSQTVLLPRIAQSQRHAKGRQASDDSTA